MKKNGWLIAIFGVIALGMMLIFGAALGAGITYYFLQADPVQAAFTGPVQVQGRGENNEVGVLISAVEAGSAAEAAGLVRGDIILEVNSVAVNNLLDLRTVLSGIEPGESAELTVLHGDDTLTLTAELGDHDGLAYLGIDTCGAQMGGSMMFTDPSGDVMIQGLGFGAEVTEVIAGSPAEEAGLQVGDLILSVNDEKIGPIDGFADLIQAREPGDKVTLEIQSAEADKSREVEVTLGENPDNPGQAYLGVGYQMGIPQDGMPHFFFHNGEEFQGQLPEGFDPNGQFFFHGKPGPEMPFMGPMELPEGMTDAVVVAEVIADTPAAEAGLQPGDLILKVADETVTEVDSFVKIMQSHQPGDQVALTVFRAGEQLEVTITLAAHPENPKQGYLGIMAGSFSIQQETIPAPDQNFEFEPGAPGGDA